MYTEQKGKGFWVTSDSACSPYLDILGKYPSCVDYIPRWMRDVPWEAISQCRVLELNGTLVFTPYEMTHPIITTRNSILIPRLNAMLLLSGSKL